jgi:REP element-mobilizing transposase RayT
MARLARVVVPALPYHLTHRGNRRGPVFFDEVDQQVYLAHLERYARRAAPLQIRIFALPSVGSSDLPLIE